MMKMTKRHRDASATSGGSGGAGRPKCIWMAVCICSLEARPLPVRDALHFGGHVTIRGNLPLTGGQQQHAACVAHDDGSARAAVMAVEFFDRDRGRRQLLDDLLHASKEHIKSRRKRSGRGNAKHTGFHENRVAVGDVDDAVPGGVKAGIDAEDAGGSGEWGVGSDKIGVRSSEFGVQSFGPLVASLFIPPAESSFILHPCSSPLFLIPTSSGCHPNRLRE